jgi:hypothetical protein
MTDFNETYAPTWELEKQLRACAVVHNTDRKYRSGRPVVEVAFYDADRREIARRDGMRLTSKKGNEYVVCRRADVQQTSNGRYVTDAFE